MTNLTTEQKTYLDGRAAPEARALALTLRSEIAHTSMDHRSRDRFSTYATPSDRLYHLVTTRPELQGTYVDLWSLKPAESSAG
jgi:hypothetical protein